MNEEINIEMVETPTDAPEASVAPDKTGGFKNPPLQGAIEDPQPKRRGVPSGAPEKTVDTGGFKNPSLQDDGKLAELETALTETKLSLAARTGDYDRLKAALDDTVSAYRKLAVSSSPLYSDDIISGSSVEEIDASIKKVNGLVKKMRSTLEAELKDLTIPAGAPERSAPDLSGLSPREKIKQGILSDKNK
jgi:hypothetical protein